MLRATILAIVPAGAAEVVSSNVVGYQKLTIPSKGFALLANPFTVVGSEGDRFRINDMFTNDSEVSNAGRGQTQADKVQTFNPATQGYTTYFYSSRVSGNGWALGSKPTAAATDEFEDGAGYWYYNYGDNAITLNVAGEVATNEVTVTLVPGFTLVCNPFPADLALNGDIDWETAGANAGRGQTQADKIQTFNPTTQGYTTYFYSSRVSGNGWALGSKPTAATTDPIPAGGGFWYFNYGNESITITLKSPLATTQE